MRDFGLREAQLWALPSFQRILKTALEFDGAGLGKSRQRAPRTADLSPIHL